MKHRSLWAAALAAICVVSTVVWFGNDALRGLQGQPQSTSLGSASNGSVTDSRRLPSSGPNFSTYSRLGSLLGRTSVHHKVHDTVLGAYTSLHASHPHHYWVFGETGWPSGGDFYPHRTHQNGLVVDFMTPVLIDGETTTLPTWPWTGWGYGLDFDEAGRGHGMTLDLEAIAAHLTALDSAARQNGLRVSKVILAPDLRRETVREYGTPQLRRLRFSNRPVWVRHDDHYHVEFRVAGE